MIVRVLFAVPNNTEAMTENSRVLLTAGSRISGSNVKNDHGRKRMKQSMDRRMVVPISDYIISPHFDVVCGTV